MTFRITYSTSVADMAALHAEFDAAIAAWRQAEPRLYGLESDAHSGWLESRSPADRRLVLGRFKTIAPSSVDAIMTRAHAAFKRTEQSWQQRVQLAEKAAALIDERCVRIAAAVALETGKNRMEALGDVQEAADLFRYYAAQVVDAKGYAREMAKLSPQENTYSLLKPYGVFVVIAPFNFPFALAAGMSAGALLGGNSVVLKPSEETPLSAQLLFEVMQDAGAPEALFQVVYAQGAEVPEALVKHSLTAGVAFTGSHQVGMRIMQMLAAQPYPKPCFLEMGGKNPAIVCESADLDVALSGCVRSAFGLTGQKCSALSRLYIHDAIYDAFMTRFAAQTAQLTMGGPWLHDVFMGPLINAAAHERYQRAIAQARTSGEIVYGGEVISEGEAAHGYFVQPTIVKADQESRLWREELFSPIVCVAKFSDFDEVLTRANDCAYGLTAGIFSQDTTQISTFMKHIEAGVTYANRRSGATTGAWPGVQSFCGWKGSGSTGKGGCGPYYVSQFMREQSQTIVESAV